MTVLELAKKYMNALSAGDVAGARSCLHPDARIWHNYDGAEQSVDENMGTFKFLLQKSTELSYDIHRMEEIEGGYLQRHTLNITSVAGDKLSSEALAMIFVEGGQITRIEEFIDPAPFAPLRDV